MTKSIPLLSRAGQYGKKIKYKILNQIPQYQYCSDNVRLTQPLKTRKRQQQHLGYPKSKTISCPISQYLYDIYIILIDCPALLGFVG